MGDAKPTNDGRYQDWARKLSKRVVNRVRMRVERENKANANEPATTGQRWPWRERIPPTVEHPTPDGWHLVPAPRDE